MEAMSPMRRSFCRRVRYPFLQNISVLMASVSLEWSRMGCVENSTVDCAERKALARFLAFAIRAALAERFDMAVMEASCGQCFLKSLYDVHCPLQMFEGFPSFLHKATPFNQIFYFVSFSDLVRNSFNF